MLGSTAVDEMNRSSEVSREDQSQAGERVESQRDRDGRGRARQLRWGDRGRSASWSKSASEGSKVICTHTLDLHPLPAVYMDLDPVPGGL